jgi:hypothetical protein
MTLSAAQSLEQYSSDSNSSDRESSQEGTPSTTFLTAGAQLLTLEAETTSKPEWRRPGAKYLAPKSHKRSDDRSQVVPKRHLLQARPKTRPRNDDELIAKPVQNTARSLVRDRQNRKIRPQAAPPTIDSCKLFRNTNSENTDMKAESLKMETIKTASNSQDAPAAAAVTDKTHRQEEAESEHVDVCEMEMGIKKKKKQSKIRIRSPNGQSRHHFPPKVRKEDPSDWADRRRQAIHKAKKLKRERLDPASKIQAADALEMRSMIKRYDLLGAYKLPVPTPPYISRPSNTRHFSFRRPQSASAAANLVTKQKHACLLSDRPRSATPNNCLRGQPEDFTQVDSPTNTSMSDCENMEVISSSEWAKQLELVIKLVKSGTLVTPMLSEKSGAPTA